jgi:hypothetical protein
MAFSTAGGVAGSVVELRQREEVAAGATADLKPKTVQGGVVAYWDSVTVAGGPATDARKEALGTQSIEGVAAEGSRLVTTIPAGQIGNERPIEIVSEQWYSKDLQMTMSSRRADPRTGETTYRVMNLQRAEPAAYLFQVPADYTVQPVLEVKPERIK